MIATAVSPELSELTTQQAKAYFTTHPDIVGQDDGTREYEVAIVQLIDKNKWTYEVIKSVLTPLIDLYATEPDLAYAAFYALCTYYRRNKQTGDYNELLTSGKFKFERKVSYGFLLLMCRKMMNPNDWTLLEEADRLCDPQVMGHNFGVMHCFAEYVADACEKEPGRTHYFVNEYMKSALDRVNFAISCNRDYAKFYITRARLHNIQAIYGDAADREPYFSQAQSDAEIAISKEKDKNKQIDYQLTSIRMQSEYYEKVLSNSIAKQEEIINQQIQENNVKNLEFLSFFSAIIGLLIAGTQLMMGMKFTEGATLLVALTGCLITAFGTIGFVLHGGKNRLLVNTIVVVLGILLTVGAMIYGGIYAA